MKTLREIVSTLEESALRWLSQFWFLVVIVLVSDGPVTLLLGYLHGPLSKTPRSGLPVSLVMMAMFVLLPVAGECALFGLLAKQPGNGSSVWKAIRTAIQSSWWSVLKVYLFTGLCMAPPFLIELAADRITGRPEHVFFQPVILIVWWFVLARFSLAVPGVVTNGWTASEAVKRSWIRTGSRLWYTLGCLLFSDGLYQIAESFRHSQRPTEFALGTAFAVAWTLGILGTFSKVVRWSIFLHLDCRETGVPVASTEVIPRPV